jgi:hypothetical protein
MVFVLIIVDTGTLDVFSSAPAAVNAATERLSSAIASISSDLAHEWHGDEDLELFDNEGTTIAVLMRRDIQ